MPPRSRSFGANLLPRGDSPQLGPFKDSDADVEFVRLLSKIDYTEIGGHAHVFEVLINSQTYALKIFKFFDASVDFSNLTKKYRDNISPRTVEAQMDPFYRECRAYGRLIDRGINGKVAVRSHGHMNLPPTTEPELKAKFQVTEWARPAEDYEKPISQRMSFRTIVKDLIRDAAPFAAKNVKSMLVSLKRIRRNGIYNMDIAARNYRGGKLLDFSASYTTPHYLFNTRPKDWAIEEMNQDLAEFDIMVEEADIKTWERATPNERYRKRLRGKDQDSSDE